VGSCNLTSRFPLSDRAIFSATELADLLSSFAKCLHLRDKYIAISLQRLGDNPQDHDGIFKGFTHDIGGVSGVRPDAYAALREANANNPYPELHHEETNFKPWKIYPQPPPPHWHWSEKPTLNPISGQSDGGQGNDFNFKTCEIPEADACIYRIDSGGVFQVYGSDPPEEDEGTLALMFGISVDHSDSRVGNPDTTTRPLFSVPTIRDYYIDLDYLLGVIADGPTKSFAYRRLKYLQGKWGMYTLLNENQELIAMKVSNLDLIPLPNVFSKCL